MAADDEAKGAAAAGDVTKGTATADKEPGEVVARGLGPTRYLEPTRDLGLRTMKCWINDRWGVLILSHRDTGTRGIITDSTKAKCLDNSGENDPEDTVHLWIYYRMLRSERHHCARQPSPKLGIR